MTKRISSLWTKHINNEDKKKEFQNTVMGSEVTLARLRELIDEMLDDLDPRSLHFDTPNWACYQASLIGERKILNKIKRLITFE